MHSHVELSHTSKAIAFTDVSCIKLRQTQENGKTFGIEASEESGGALEREQSLEN
jgi:hypothetical protein